MIQLPASTTSTRPRRSSARPRSSSSTTSRPRSSPPSIDAAQNPVAVHEPLRPADARAVGPEGRAGAVLALQLDARRSSSPARPRRCAQLKNSAEVKALKPLKPRRSRRRASRRPRRCDDAGLPDRLPGADDAEQARRDHVLRRDRGRLPGRSPGCRRRRRPTTTSSSTTRTPTRRRRQMNGHAAEAQGHAAGLRPDSGQPIVTLQFTGKGNKSFHEITRDEAIRGRALGDAAALRDRARQRDPLVPADRLQAVPERDRPDAAAARRSPGLQNRSARRRTSRSCSRRARCRSSSSPSSAPTSRRRSARTR